MPGAPPAPVLQMLTIRVRKQDTTPVEGCWVYVYDGAGIQKYSAQTPASGDMFLNFWAPPAFDGWTIELIARGYSQIRLDLSRIAATGYEVHATMDATLP